MKRKQLGVLIVSIFLLIPIVSLVMPGVIMTSPIYDAHQKVLVLGFQNQSLLPKTMYVPSEGSTFYCLDKEGMAMRPHLSNVESALIQRATIFPFQTYSVDVDPQDAFGLTNGKDYYNGAVQFVFNEESVRPRKVLFIFDAVPIKLQRKGTLSILGGKVVKLTID